ncbi:MAG: hypothetical protein WCE54_17655 [Ignavibacteriaceae bacterium]
MNKDLLEDYFTRTEIFNQPELWIKTYEKILIELQAIKNFLNGILSRENLEIILTGAGTSAFIGDVLEGSFQKGLNTTTKAISTTNLVTHPEFYLNKNKPLLLVSFARSGNSPESSKAIELSEIICKEVYHLVITCSDTSTLIDSLNRKKSYLFVLPDKSNDKGLAMTASFTSMLLTGLLISNYQKAEELNGEIKILSGYGDRILNEYSEKLKEVSKIDFERAVFLGSGPLKGIARESHLKLQELTDGKVICKHDSFLGFRHGPKAVVNEKSLLVYLFSNNKYVNRYELDLVNAINEGRKPVYTIGIMEKKIDGLEMSLPIILSDKGNPLNEDFLSVPLILPAQLIGFYKSINLGLNPDSPSADGMISRVVEGVELYPYKK